MNLLKTYTIQSWVYTHSNKKQKQKIHIHTPARSHTHIFKLILTLMDLFMYTLLRLNSASLVIEPLT